MDWLPIVAVLLLIHGFLMLWCFTIMNNRVQLALIMLDSKIAGAIGKVIAEGIPQIEQVNPIQAALAQMLAGGALGQQKRPPPLEIPKDEQGKFSG